LHHVITDNHALSSLDVSDNSCLLTSNKHVELMASMIAGSRLRSLYINNVGLQDAGLEKLAHVLPTSTVMQVALHGNFIGSTGANIVANLSKPFYCDALGIHRSKIKSAPFYKAKDRDRADSELGWDGITQLADDVLRSPQRKGVSSMDDDGSFEDTDLFDGEDSLDEDSESENKVSRYSTMLRRPSNVSL
jgi:hypothetical protein